jgi:phosphopantothenoylcysteine decarboxylase/phosphopantothenate--cysteine ligase
VELVPVLSTGEMLAVLQELMPAADVLFMAAAPSDFRPAAGSKDKLKDAALVLELVRTPDILTELGKVDHHAFLVGFSVETKNALAGARKKLRAKGLDLIVANPAETMHSGSVTATLVFKGGKTRRFPRQSKSDFAASLVNEVAARLADGPAVRDRS